FLPTTIRSLRRKWRRKCQPATRSTTGARDRPDRAWRTDRHQYSQIWGESTPRTVHACWTPEEERTDCHRALGPALRSVRRSDVPPWLLQGDPYNSIYLHDEANPVPSGPGNDRNPVRAGPHRRRGHPNSGT